MSNAIAINIPETAPDAELGKLIIPQAREVRVTSQSDYENALVFMRLCKKNISGIETKMNESIDLAFKLHRNLTQTRSALCAPYVEAHKIVEAAASSWWREQERLKQEAELKARREAQERADAERREKERLLEDERLKTAQEYHDAGMKEEAQKIIDAPIYVPPVPVSMAHVTAIIPTAQKVKGSAVRQKWVPDIYDDSLLPREYLMRDEAKIKKVVAALGPEAKIPGVNVVEDIKISTRRIVNE